MATSQMIFFLILFLCSCSSSSSLRRTSPSGTIGEKSKLSGGGGKGGMSNGGGQSGQPDVGSTNQNPRGSSAVIPIYAANAHHNSHRNAAGGNSPTAIPPLFCATLLAFLV
ncbi:PREDICTED: uncharacterized protein LOC109186628 [Ipomoea nil]|uniref:uncharacterized protein LOC109186628 n=1 Tax=Ipomoea nil TaxID=35883 RepID=UPI0009013D93|nr:PREDICTED: uncharacterized protein LOC109186628 [Ipomoea nil]